MSLKFPDSFQSGFNELVSPSLVMRKRTYPYACFWSSSVIEKIGNVNKTLKMGLKRCEMKRSREFYLFQLMCCMCHVVWCSNVYDERLTTTFFLLVIFSLFVCAWKCGKLRINFFPWPQKKINTSYKYFYFLLYSVFFSHWHFFLFWLW